MTRVSWDAAGSRQFEAGIDHGVLYVDGESGVPWVGLIAVNERTNGGESKPRYLDGIKITNGHEPEEFEATIEAYTYPVEFERCDGTNQLAHGLRVRHQRRMPFGMTYRTRVGDEIQGLDIAYRIHILYNLSAEPSERASATMSETIDPINFSWRVTSRAPVVNDIRPSAHFIIDSRDTPQVLLDQVTDILYGSSEEDPRLIEAGELVFMFTSFLNEVYDAGDPYDPVFATYDAGTPATAVTSTIDGGTP